MSNRIIAWLLPLIISLLLFVIVRPVFAQVIESQANLAQYLTANAVEVGSEVGNHGFLQVYYVWNNSKKFITDDQNTNADPVTDGEYIVWMKQTGGVWQIFLYHTPTENVVQLTNSGTNVNPRISGDKIVWEGWIDGGWQVFFFDGKSVGQLTGGDISMNPDIEGDNIVYGRKDIAGTWRAVVYSISKNEAKEITTGVAAKRPALENGQIILGRFKGKGGEKFPLTVDDLFLLDLDPLTAPDETPSPEPTPLLQPETVTEEEIVEELQATPSAVLEEATQSAEIQ